jgi:hypothetical protein
MTFSQEGNADQRGSPGKRLWCSCDDVHQARTSTRFSARAPPGRVSSRLAWRAARSAPAGKIRAAIFVLRSGLRIFRSALRYRGAGRAAPPSEMEERAVRVASASRNRAAALWHFNPQNEPTKCAGGGRMRLSSNPRGRVAWAGEDVLGRPTTSRCVQPCPRSSGRAERTHRKPARR